MEKRIGKQSDDWGGKQIAEFQNIAAVLFFMIGDGIMWQLRHMEAGQFRLRFI